MPEVATQTVPPKAKEGSLGFRLHQKANKSVDRCFYLLGYLVGLHPWVTLSLCWIFVIICCFGFIKFRVETDGKKLWVPANSVSQEEESVVRSYFTQDSTYAVVMLEASSTDGNVLTKDTIDALWELDAQIQEIETTKGNQYPDLCTKGIDGETCEPPARGITRFWGNDFNTYVANVTTDADVLAAINVPMYPDGQAVTFESIFGNTIKYDDGGNVAAARATIQIYTVITSALDIDVYKETYEWQGSFQDSLELEVERGSYDDFFNIRFITGRSVDDAVEASIAGETYLLVISYLLMMVFVVMAMGRCGERVVQRRCWLGQGGVLCVAAAGFAAYGVSSGFGVPYTSLASILPFILLGTGVDDMFLIVASYDHTDAKLSVEQRMAFALQRCGVSVTYTSLTNFFAFMLGSLTSLPGVRYFCLYAGTSILLDYFIQMTAFVALATLDAKRQIASRIDFCCCFTDKQYLQEENRPSAVGPISIDDAKDDGKRHPRYKSSAGSPAAEDVYNLSALGRWMKEKYTSFLLSKPGQILVLTATAALLGAGIYGTKKATQGFDVVDIIPDRHFARDYNLMSRELGLEIDGQFVPLGVYTGDVDYKETDVQVQVQITDQMMAAQQFVSGPVDSWLTSFVMWANSTSEYRTKVMLSEGYPVYQKCETFYEALSVFLQDGENARFNRDVIFDRDGNTIKFSRSNMYLVGVSDTTNSVDALMDARDVVEASTLDVRPIAYSGTFAFTEQFVVIYRELITNFAFALAAVVILSLFVLGNIKIALLVCLTVVVIDVELLGFVYYLGLEVNSITIIGLIMAVGLLVDYTVHVMHYFLHQDTRVSKRVRIAATMGEIGPSVMLGAATTFVGILPLSIASNAIFRVFFKMFLIIITFGIFHGIVFVPVALSLIPEESPKTHPAGVDEAEKFLLPRKSPSMYDMGINDTGINDTGINDRSINDGASTLGGRPPRPIRKNGERQGANGLEKWYSGQRESGSCDELGDKGNNPLFRAAAHGGSSIQMVATSRASSPGGQVQMVATSRSSNPGHSIQMVATSRSSNPTFDSGTGLLHTAPSFPNASIAHDALRAGSGL